MAQLHSERAGRASSELSAAPNGSVIVEGEIFSGLLDHVPHGVAVCRLQYEGRNPSGLVCIYTNLAFWGQIGLQPTAGRNTELREALPELFIAVVRIAAGGTPEPLEVFLEASPRWLSIQISELQPKRFVVVVNDITETKRALDALAESEQHYRAILEDQTELICRFRSDGAIQYVNDAYCRFFGKSREALLGSSWQPLAVPQDIPHINAQLSRMSPTQPVVLIENRVFTGDGEIRWAQFVNRGFFDNDGHLVETQSIGRDITEQKRANAALADHQEMLQSIMDNTPALVFIKDRSERYMLINRRCEEVLGVRLENIRGKTAHDFLPKKIADQFAANDRRVLASGQSQQVEETVFYNGIPHVYASIQFPLFRGQERPQAICGISTDITGLKQIERELRDADRRKNEFLATLAHELRNPLAPISNALRILERTGLAYPRAHELLAMIDRQVNHLVRLVDDLLEISRISQGKIELKKKVIDLGTTVHQAVEINEPLIQARGHELKLSLSPEPLRVVGDPVRLAQVFANLINNAAKYTPNGGRIWITAERHEDEAVVTVRDTGLGIPDEMLPQVFQLFVQVDRGPEHLQDGLGIGLALVRKLIELHGGRVEVRSGGVGGGSEFIVRLLLETSRTSARSLPGQSSATSRASTRRVLVADDNSDAADSLAILLESMGHEVRIARDGLEAVEIAADFQPDLMLLDIGMPRLNGYGACRRIRAEAWGRKAVIVALSGYGENREETRDAGFDRYLIKPLDPQELERLLQSVGQN